MPSYTASVQDKIVEMSYKTSVDSIRLKESSIYWTSFHTKLWGVSRIEIYTQLEKAEPYSMFDEDLTRGYIHTSAFMKTNRYNSTAMVQFIGFDFLAQLAAIMVGCWWFFKGLHELLPMRLNSDIDVSSTVYRVSESNDSTNVMQLNNAM